LIIFSPHFSNMTQFVNLHKTYKSIYTTIQHKQMQRNKYASHLQQNTNEKQLLPMKQCVENENGTFL